MKRFVIVLLFGMLIVSIVFSQDFTLFTRQTVDKPGLKWYLELYAKRNNVANTAKYRSCSARFSFNATSGLDFTSGITDVSATASWRDITTYSAATITPNFSSTPKNFSVSWGSPPTSNASCVAWPANNEVKIGRFQMNIADPTLYSDVIWYATTAATSAYVLDATDVSIGNNRGSTTTFSFTAPDVVLLPVELTSFTVTVNNLNAQLKWSTATEVNNFGFDIERRAISDQPSAVSSWAKVGFVNGNGTSNVQHSYSFSDNITESGTYAYRLKQIDNSGTFKYSQETQVTIEVPKVFTLSQNYPNPFNPTTNIDFTVAADGKAVLKVYNTLGQEVAELYNGMAQAGRIIKTHFDASRLASGIYFSRLEADGKSLVKRMMFIK